MAIKDGAASVALRVQAAALRAQADALEALAASLGPEADELLDLQACKAHDVGRDALKGAAERGELAISRGPRGKLLVKRSALEAWLASKPYKPPPSEPAPDLEAWERSVTRKAS